MSRGQVRIGCAGGYLEGRIQPGLDLAREASCDYLSLEALNEASLSVLQRSWEANPEAGFHAKGVDKILSLVGASAKTSSPRCAPRLISSIGGANPAAGARAVAKRLRDAGTDRTIASITGDNLTGRLPELVEEGALVNADGSTVTKPEIEGVFAASAYLGAQPIAEALDAGADIVVTGRVVDSALYLGPLMHEFGWTSDDVDLLAAGSVAGHLLECAGHLLGGNYWGPGWEQIDYANIGHGIGDIAANGAVEVTKLPGASGLINRHTVLQQLLYEIGDPSGYVLPDVVVDLTHTTVREVGPERVRIEDVVGHAAPSTLKVLLSRRAGYLAEGIATFTWPEATRKASKATQSLAQRLRAVHGIEEVRIDHLGAGGLTPLPAESFVPEAAEVTLRVAAAAPTMEQAAGVHAELANFYDCAPGGACGISGPTAGSGAAVRDRIDIVPCLVASDLVKPRIDILRS